MRQNTLSCFNECVKSLRDRNINVVVHIINGLPYETKEMMLDTIKYLNSIRYRFTEQDIVANSNSPVEEVSLTPYSGLTIRAFSNETDTETLNVLIPYIPYGTAHNSFMNYTKPYYDRGNWNFNYLFNKKHNANTRVYGNYIIIDFNIKTANDTNTKNVIIEDVNFNISAI